VMNLRRSRLVASRFASGAKAIASSRVTRSSTAIA
jgi:hypothetical protein